MILTNNELFNATEYSARFANNAKVYVWQADMLTLQPIVENARQNFHELVLEEHRGQHHHVLISKKHCITTFTGHFMQLKAIANKNQFEFPEELFEVLGRVSHYKRRIVKGKDKMVKHMTIPNWPNSKIPLSYAIVSTATELDKTLAKEDKAGNSVEVEKVIKSRPYLVSMRISPDVFIPSIHRLHHHVLHVTAKPVQQGSLDSTVIFRRPWSEWKKKFFTEGCKLTDYG